MLPKTGMFLPNGEKFGPYRTAIAYALQKQLGTTHQAVKIIRRWTGAGERTVKNWLGGISGPNGQHLVDLIRNSDEVLEILLLLAGRQQFTASMKLVDLRNKLAEMLQQVDKLMDETAPTSGADPLREGSSPNGRDRIRRLGEQSE